jgi:hypothetical protein
VGDNVSGTGGRAGLDGWDALGLAGGDFVGTAPTAGLPGVEPEGFAGGGAAFAGPNDERSEAVDGDGEILGFAGGAEL